MFTIKQNKNKIFILILLTFFGTFSILSAQENLSFLEKTSLSFYCFFGDCEVEKIVEVEKQIAEKKQNKIIQEENEKRQLEEKKRIVENRKVEQERRVAEEKLKLKGNK